MSQYVFIIIICAVSIPLRVEASIYVTGNSDPADAIIYNDTHISSLTNQGPIVDHK